MSFCTNYLSVILTLLLFHNVRPNCIFHAGNYDLSALDLQSGWPVAGPLVNGTVSRYEINLCRPLNYSSPYNTGCPKSSVCQISGSKAISFGNAIENTSNYAIADNIGDGFSLYVLTKTLCGNSGVYRSTIYFACGPNIGAPELMLWNDCQVNFYWRTSAACPAKPKSNQVPCYVIDNNGNKRDLSPLILNKGGYFVNTLSPYMDFIINVCSDLSLDEKIKGCPVNSSACRRIGSEHLTFGVPKNGLTFTQEGLVLVYETTELSPIASGCDLKPKTTILFKCPVRGHSQPPKMISDLLCQYEVVWETEYACPENLLKGSLKTCQFVAETHGVEIDLSPLKKQPVYTNIISNSSNDFTFTLSVCGGLGNFSCGGKRWKSGSVCRHNLSSNTSEIVGTTEGSELRYADGEVILTYPKGSTCEEGMKQSSAINFVCDPNAGNNGDGKPRHIMSNQCVHLFEWATKHACMKHPLDTPCSVTHDKKKISLQKLLLTNGEGWEAIDRTNLQNKTFAEYYINVCGQVSRLGNLTICGKDSSACALSENGEYISLGSFVSPPVYDAVSESVKLHYTGGSPCRDGKLWKSSFDFICRPGHIISEPILTRINYAQCQYEFEWHTAEACPEGLIEGSNCKVYDSNLGISYDLTPLKSKVYKIDTESYSFSMGVCQPVPDTPCSANQSYIQNVGVCQVDKSSGMSWKTGESNSNLSYMDGVVNLTYLSGDPYNDQNRTARMTMIIFICDFNAGNGNPIFEEEVDFAYIFHWYTSLVCPHSISTECMVHDKYSHLIYDLSGLSMTKQNWMTIINEDNKERQIYLNVCRSLTLPIGCDSSAAACIVENSDDGEKVIVSNIGRVTGPPVLETLGHLTLTYTNGDPCIAYGENITYSTVIHFLCAEDKLARSGLRFLSKIGACEYTILWTTKAACPTGTLQSENVCQLTDPDSGFTFDLTSLRRDQEPYTVSSDSNTFQFNVCGKVNKGCLPASGTLQTKNISVCETDKDGILISEIAVADSFFLRYSIGEDLTLTYKSDSSSKVAQQEVVIKFPCSNTSVSPVPKFIKYENSQYVFELKTSLTCIAAHFECSFVDRKGNEYDLSPLAKYNDGNWEVADNRAEYSHLRYHINFCRPLNKVRSYQCPGGASAACQTNTIQSESTGHDLGSQMHEPVLSEGHDTGLIIVHYTNGTTCHNTQFRRSTMITLFCSGEEGDLKFIGETPECMYMFSLDTPFACPVQSSVGSRCTVKDPAFGYLFDLNPLKSKNSSYVVTVGEYSFSFNVCDKLNGFDNACANSSVCQTKPKDPGFSKSLGLPNDVLVYRKGLITLEYESGSGNCHGKYNRSTKITFTCHHGYEDKDGPSFVSEAEDCSYLFEWPTVHACPPFDVIECSVVDDNDVYYDLSKLSLPSDNYYVKNPLSEKKTFVINICRSIVNTPDSLCPYTSAVCMVDNAKTGEPINLGRVSQAPYIDNGKIKINYTSGDPCDEEKTTSAQFMQTVIEFSCDIKNIDSEPHFVGKDGCTYYFDWPTAYACPKKNARSTSDCTVEDPITGYLYNLSSLKSHGLFKYKNSKHQYYLNICGNGSSSPCGSESGMCQEELSGTKRHWSGGKANSKLTLNGGSLILNYSDGDSCHNDQFKRNTIVEFHCGHGVGEPKFLYESDNCTYYFSWKTELACQTQLHCAVKNGSHYYDLTSLDESYYTAASSVLNDHSSYYISICNSLSRIPNVPCPPGAAICKVTKDPKTSMIIAESLGRVEYPPFVDFMGHATVLYTNGSICPTNLALQNRARIIFLCDVDAEVGEPVLFDTEYDECLYIFEWRTNVVCPERPEIPSIFTSCNYTDNSRGIHFDLLPLQKRGPKPFYEVPGGEKNATFLLNVCSTLRSSNLSKCTGAGICSTEESSGMNYGLALSQKFTFDGRRLRLTFSDGEDCPSGINGKRTSEIFFVCDPSARIGTPVLYKKYTCMVVFMWKTALVCQNMQQECTFDVDGSHYDFNLLSSLTHNWNMTKGKNTYWINLCRGIQPTAETMGCWKTAAVCMVDSSGYPMSLGMLHTMQIKPINSTDLLLTFEHGDSRACADVASDTVLHAVTRIFMRCGSFLGNPRIFSGPDSKCYYDFVWESSLACADKVEEVMMEKDGIITDTRFDYSIDISDILNRTFTIPGNSTSDHYIYTINLNGISQNTSEPQNPCSKAAVCQTKPNSNFARDIGSIDTRTFLIRDSELYLTLVSHTRPCGKNKFKNVTTLINLHCSSYAGIGNPTFLYETGDCDYIFDWETVAVCSNFHKKKPDAKPDTSPKPDKGPEHYKDEQKSSHKAEIAVGVIFAIVALMLVAFVVLKPQRRAIVTSRFRSMFGRVNLPYFRYKRFGGERLILIDAAQTLHYDDDRDIEMLT